RRHRYDVARPFPEQAVITAPVEGEVPIEQPRRGRRAQEREQAPDIGIDVDFADQQLHDAGVDEKPDEAADTEPGELLRQMPHISACPARRTRRPTWRRPAA